ncbi:hypothetical protein K504DRAFT_274305 [Pleomassaria siparia CBS 279.74]|uniref:Myb-like domain-containing protein n=1 Tax=Pleomassaria siparia CBS 279.74 TaxID=1314801 RepID=A0A6G1KA81_9PLEO|nr:hypothetical protein K504DRAFT_274305 [Pleomassaria siparia CBS 279.74]
MPKMAKAHLSRTSVSTTVSAAGGGSRSSSWSAKDDETLITARAQNMNWNQIAPKHFPSKSPNACRKRHERLMERQNAEQWDGVKLDVLAQAYMDVRRDMWTILAAKVGEKWTLVEQKCMEKGMKNLTQAYRSAQKKQGAYDDSGVDLEEEESDDRQPLSDVLEDSPQPDYLHDAHLHHHGQAQVQVQGRVPSIQSMLQYTTSPHPQHHLQIHNQYHHSGQ